MTAAALPIPRGRTRIKSLDGVRGIAVILVLAVHFSNMAVLPQTAAMFRWLASIMSWGWCGVDLFFVLSGFLITGILLDTRNADNRWKRFYSRRILRIFPLYYAVLLLCLAAAILLPHLPPGKLSGPSAIGWASYFLYLQNWWLPFGQLHHMESLGPLWSLAIEEQFYLLWPLIVWRLSASVLVKICSFGVLGAFLLRWCLMPHATGALAFVVYMNTLTRMDGLLAGAFCAIAVRNAILLERVWKLMPAAVAVALGGLALIVLSGHQAWNDKAVLVYGHLFLTIGFGCFVLSAYLLNDSGTPFDRFIRSRGLTVFGKYSYGIYVYQGFILEGMLQLYRHRPWWVHTIQNPLILALVWTVAPFVLAFLSYHLLEKKFLLLSDSFLASPLVLLGADATRPRHLHRSFTED